MKTSSSAFTCLVWGVLISPMVQAASSCQSFPLPNGVIKENESGIIGPYGTTVSTQGCAGVTYSDTFPSGYSFQAAAQASSVALHASASTIQSGPLSGAAPQITAIATSVLPFTVTRQNSAVANLALLEFEVQGDGLYGTAVAPDTLAGFYTSSDFTSAPGTSRSFSGSFHDSQGTNNSWDGQHNITGPSMAFDYTTYNVAYFEPGANYFSMVLGINVRGLGFADLSNTHKLVGITVYTPGFELSFADAAFVSDPQRAGHYLLNLPTTLPVPELEVWSLMLAGLCCVGTMAFRSEGSRRRRSMSRLATLSDEPKAPKGSLQKVVRAFYPTRFDVIAIALLPEKSPIAH